MVHALRSSGILRIGFALSYVTAINDMAVAFLSEPGMLTVTRSEVEMACGNYGLGSLCLEAVVLSCTGMRSVDVIARPGARLGKPVTTSQQAMMFQAMQPANIGGHLPGSGQ